MGEKPPPLGGDFSFNNSAKFQLKIFLKNYWFFQTLLYLCIINHINNNDMKHTIEFNRGAWYVTFAGFTSEDRAKLDAFDFRKYNGEFDRQFDCSYPEGLVRGASFWHKQDAKAVIAILITDVSDQVVREYGLYDSISGALLYCQQMTASEAAEANSNLRKEGSDSRFIDMAKTVEYEEDAWQYGR